MNVVQEAETKGKKDVAIEMLRKDMSIALIVELTKISEEEILKLKAEIGE